MLLLKVISINRSVKYISKNVVKILNNNRMYFLEILEDEKLINTIKNWERIHTNELYPQFEYLRKRIEGYSPNLLGITDKPKNSHDITTWLFIFKSSFVRSFLKFDIDETNHKWS